MSREAPEGWASATLGEVIRLEYGRALSASARDPGNIPVYGSNGVCGEHSMPLVPERGIVVGRKGTAGSVTVTTGPFWPIDTTYYVVPRLDVDFDWLAATLEHARLHELNESTGVPGLNRDKAYLQSILLPPLDEQRRIAEVLRSVDEATSGNRAVLAKASESLALLSDQLLVVNAQRIGEPTRLGDLIETLEAGVSVNSEGRTVAPDEIGILKTSCVSAGYFEPTEHKAVLESERSRVRTPVSGDSIIISRMNTFELVGANAFVNADYADLYLPDRLWLLKTNARVRVRWLAFYMKTAKFREQVISIATGTSGSMKNISKGRLNDLIVYVPDDQQQVEDIDALSAVELALLTARKLASSQQITGAALKSDLLSGRVRVPA